MNRGNTWAIYRDPRDLETPIRIDVGTFASAWLDVKEAKKAMEALRKAIEEADPDRCQGCPECAVVFDSEGIHGHVPDRNSRTCQSCEHYKGATQ